LGKKEAEPSAWEDWVVAKQARVRKDGNLYGFQSAQRERKDGTQIPSNFPIKLRWRFTIIALSPFRLIFLAFLSLMLGVKSRLFHENGENWSGLAFW
jgi:hypothetical protein